MSVAIEVFVHVRCAAAADKPPSQAFTSSAGADQATVSLKLIALEAEVASPSRSLSRKREGEEVIAIKVKL